MIEDIKTLENHSQVNTDICVVGAGAAGITLALELNTFSKDVVLLEAGGFDYPTEDEGSNLYSGESTGRSYEVKHSRLRYFGGTTNHWGGWCRPLDRIDFESKPHNVHSGWPIARGELSKYYQRAAEICEIDDFDKFEQLNNSESNNVLDLQKNSVLTNKYFVFSPPTRFGNRYRQDIINSNNINCFLHANATELIIRDGIIKGVKIRDTADQRHQINANKVVLAMGGLENARFLLLNSNSDRSTGIPNENDLIGRFFMDHPGVRPGSMLLQKELKYYRYKNATMPLMPVLSLSDKTMVDEGLNNVAIMLKPKKEDAALPGRYLDNSFFDSMDGGALYSLETLFEPTPYAESRVTLSQKIDSFGQKKLDLSWQIDPGDFDIVERTFQIIARELGTTNLGRMKIIEKYVDRFKQGSGYGMHHIGTTRMGKDPSTSVVDSFGESHEIEGLFVAGSSVFPTAGFSNPTLTIMALAARLAERLKQAI